MSGVDDLHALAAAAGLARQWRNAEGQLQIVAADDLAAILAALGYSAGSAADWRHGLNRIRDEKPKRPLFLSADVGEALHLPTSLVGANSAELHLEDGQSRRLIVEAGRLTPIMEAGYHQLEISGHQLTLAIAPAACYRPERNGWGVALQIPSLHGPYPFGTLQELSTAAHLFGAKGADTILLSPVHAILPASGVHFSPYAPSSRRFLNSALAAPFRRGELAGSADLIDWETALPAAHACLQACLDKLSLDERVSLDQWAAEQGPALRQHAIFDALYLALGSFPRQQWPAALQDAHSAEVRQFALSHTEEAALHLLGQRLADNALADAQSSAKASGMRTGLIADVAVGVDPDGSDVWADPSSYLSGLTIGAPPDPLGPMGQNWGLTTFSPNGLRDRAFSPWIDVVRAALRHAGGLRIDHAFGLQRLWVIPEGRPSSAGAYLSYPVEDMMRILTLESHRSKAIVIAEDLGTVPEGFRNRMEARGMLGMRVLWFERGEDGSFAQPCAYPRMSVAMTGTHDTPTIAGWWQGRDIDWSEKVASGFDRHASETARHQDRRALLDRVASESTSDPANVSTETVVDAAIAHIAATHSTLKILPMEDFLGLEEQTNIPGTLGNHPNWRRRLPGTMEQLLGEADVARRIDILNEQSEQPSKV